MPITAQIDQFGRPAWIILMILSFIVFWPLGLMVLAFMIWSGRMGCGWHGGPGRWEYKMARMQDKMDHLRDRMDQQRDWWNVQRDRWNAPRSSGNRAFDEYRAETLRRLEEEQKEFRQFLERLRFAKDKTEFDAFMAERRNRPAPDAPPQQN